MHKTMLVEREFPLGEMYLPLRFAMDIQPD